MKRWITIDGKKHLIRGPYTRKELEDLYKQFVKKFNSKLTFLQYLGERGKIYF